MKVFSKGQFAKREGFFGESGYIANRSWVDKCDGKRVTGNGEYKMCGDCFVVDDWCIDAPDAEKKMYTMQDFADGGIAVCVPANRMEDFLRMCDAAGLRWNGGEAPLEYIPQISDCLAYSRDKMRGTDGIVTGVPDLFEYAGYILVDFERIEENPRYKIVIESYGKATTARMEINGKEVNTAKARCNPADKFNWKTGATLAFMRLFESRKKRG